MLHERQRLRSPGDTGGDCVDCGMPRSQKGKRTSGDDGRENAGGGDRAETGRERGVDGTMGIGRHLTDKCFGSLALICGSLVLRIFNGWIPTAGLR